MCRRLYPELSTVHLESAARSSFRGLNKGETGGLLCGMETDKQKDGYIAFLAAEGDVMGFYDELLAQKVGRDLAAACLATIVPPIEAYT